MSSYDAPEKSCTQRFEKPVEAIGTDVDALTLWDDDRLVATFEPESPVPGVGHTFEWLGLRPGPHLLHATAHGSKGTAHSAPVGVEVFLTSTTPTELPVSAPSGTTAAMLAAATGVDEGSITADGEIADATAPGSGSAAATRPAFVVDAPAVAEAAAADLADSAAEAVAGVGTDVIAGSPDTGGWQIPPRDRGRDTAGVTSTSTSTTTSTGP